jgi:hypothetical protein
MLNSNKPNDRLEMGLDQVVSDVGQMGRTELTV